NTGHIAPGSASTPGTLTINGNVTFGSASNLDVRLNGASSFDSLAVTGTAALDGTITATKGVGYTPNSESFGVLTFGNRSGAFANRNLPADFIYTYNANDLTLTHAPAGVEFWTNAAGDFLWTTPSNWSLNRVPVGTDDVTLNASGG